MAIMLITSYTAIATLRIKRKINITDTEKEIYNKNDTFIVYICFINEMPPGGLWVNIV